MGLRFTKSTDLIPSVTVELRYIPRADTHSNHLKQRDRLIHPTNQYEFPDPEEYKSVAAHGQFFSPTCPPGPGKGGLRNMCQWQNGLGFYIDRNCTGLQILRGSWDRINVAEGEEGGGFVGVWACITFQLIMVCILQRCYCLLENNKEKSCQVCPCPLSRDSSHLKGASGLYPVLFKKYFNKYCYFLNIYV